MVSGVECAAGRDLLKYSLSLKEHVYISGMLLDWNSSGAS